MAWFRCTPPRWFGIMWMSVGLGYFLLPFCIAYYFPPCFTACHSFPLQVNWENYGLPVNQNWKPCAHTMVFPVRLGQQIVWCKSVKKSRKEETRVQDLRQKQEGTCKPKPDSHITKLWCGQYMWMEPGCAIEQQFPNNLLSLILTCWINSHNWVTPDIRWITPAALQQHTHIWDINLRTWAKAGSWV